MVYKIKGKDYYTLEEAKEISNKTIKQNAKKFSQEVISRQENNITSSKNQYV